MSYVLFGLSQLIQAQMDDSFHGKGCGMKKGKSESFSLINDHNKQKQHTSDREPMLGLRTGTKVNSTIILLYLEEKRA